MRSAKPRKDFSVPRRHPQDPLKGNQTGERKPKGAKPGHRGAGRKGFTESEADQVVQRPRS